MRRSTVAAELVDGLFRVRLPAASSYRVTVSAEGLQRLDLGEWTVTSRAEVDAGTWVLDAGAQVVGTFLDRETGTPVADVQLAAQPVGRAWIGATLRGEAHSAASDVEGGFTLPGLEPGRYAITYAAPKGQRGLRLATIHRREKLDLGVVWVDGGGAIEGRVLERDGSPVASAPVRLHDAAAEMLDPFAETVTASDGTFRLAGLEPAEYLLRVGSPAVAYSALEEAARKPRLREIVLSVVRLRGRALRNGQPLEGVSLVIEGAWDLSRARQKVVVEDRREGARARRLIGAGAARCDVVTSFGGEFSCVGLAPGPVSATLLAERAEVVRFLDVPDAEEAVFDLEFGGTDLSGVALRATGEGDGHLIVAARDDGGKRWARALAGQNGDFLLPGLPDMPLRIQVEAAARLRAELGPLLPREAVPPIVLDLHPRPERGLEIELRGAADLGSPQPELVLLDGAGELVQGSLVVGERARFRGVPAGSYWLAWDDPVYGAGMRSLTLDPGRESLRSPLVLEPGGEVRVECDATRYAGRPIRSIRVLTRDGLDLSPFLSGVVPGLRFSEDCRLVLGRLGSGRYEIELGVGEEISRRSVAVREGDGATLRFP